MEEKKTGEINLAKDAEGKTNRPSKKRKPPSDKDHHIWINVAMCVTDSETKQKSSNCLIPRTGKILPSSWLGWWSSCIFHTISMRSSIHFVQRADCHFPLEIHKVHWPYVLCQTETLSSTFSESVSWRMSLSPFCWFSSLCVCTTCHSMGQQTDKASAITGDFLHLALLSSPLQVHALSADSCLVPDSFLRRLCDSVLLGCFLTHPNAKPPFLLCSHPASTNFVFSAFCFVLI